MPEGYSCPLHMHVGRHICRHTCEHAHATLTTHTIHKHQKHIHTTHAYTYYTQTPYTHTHTYMPHTHTILPSTVWGGKKSPSISVLSIQEYWVPSWQTPNRATEIDNWCRPLAQGGIRTVRAQIWKYWVNLCKKNTEKTVGPSKGGRVDRSVLCGFCHCHHWDESSFLGEQQGSGGGFLSRKFCRGWSGSAHRGAMREVRAMNQSQAKANSCCEQEPEGSM